MSFVEGRASPPDGPALPRCLFLDVGAVCDGATHFIKDVVADEE